MPRKATLPDFFQRCQSNVNQVYCTICCTGHVSAPRYIALSSIRTHVESDTHKRALDLIQSAQRTEVNNTRDSELQAAQDRDILAGPTALASDIHIHSVHLTMPKPTEYNQVPDDFWENTDHNLGPNPEGEADLEIEHLRQAVQHASMWDHDSLAKALGIYDQPSNKELLQEEEEDAIMQDLMKVAASSDSILESILGPGKPVFNSADKLEENNPKWHPYRSKTMCVLDILTKCPRLRVSKSLLVLILWAMKVCGTPDVPSLYALEKVQKELRTTCGIPSIECKSTLGNVFFMNDVRSIIAQDWANISIRPHIHVYPEIPEDGIIREVWHAEKWRHGLDLDVLSPMYDAGNSKHFYVFEIARLLDGRLVIPQRWVLFKGEVHADLYVVTTDSQGAHVDDAMILFIPANQFCANYLDLKHENTLPTKWSDCSVTKNYPGKMPNKYRELAQGDPIYSSFIDYFGDDVSGNRTKSWNKHNNAYITHRNLPRRFLHQEFHTHFISTSQTASITEQYTAFKTVVETTHSDPVQVQDSHGLTTRFIIHIHAGPADNPASAEMSANIGGTGNHPCRKCNVGGSRTSKESDEGFHALFDPGIPRKGPDIVQELLEQAKLACKGVVTPIMSRQRETGIKDSYTQFWIDRLIEHFKSLRASGKSTTDAELDCAAWLDENKDKIISGFFSTKGFDPTKDTPIEILHTILLGTVKYIWFYSHNKWPASTKQLYTARLQSTDRNGLSIPAIRAQYIMDYAGSLIGRQLKIVIQTSLFHVHDLVGPEHFLAWRAVGELSALLWFTEIDNLDRYVADVTIAVGNVQDSLASIDPSKMLWKIKLHLLAHLPEDIKAFGPLVGLATETFKSFNAIFRYCSVLSNHLAPSRDIARQLGDQESMKHRLTGGLYKDIKSGTWKQAGTEVRNFIQANPALHATLGWSSPQIQPSGTVNKQLLSNVERKASTDSRLVKLNETVALSASNSHSYDLDSGWTKCRNVVAESCDVCPIHCWVFATSPVTDKTIIGRIATILHSISTGEGIVVLEEFYVAPTRDDFFHLPYVSRRQNEISHVIVPAKSILFIVNIQHDCRHAGCEASGRRARRQERQDTEQEENFIVHKNDNRFLINLMAFHNAHLIRRILPRDLTKPQPLFPNRESTHQEMSARLRKTQDGKRAQHAEKKRKTPVEAETSQVAQKRSRLSALGSANG